jgi:hypothetical protein
MRARILPSIEREFPRAVEHLVAAGLEAQNAGNGNGSTTDGESPVYRALFGAAGLRLRRSHWEILTEKVKEGPHWTGVIHLPDGWILRAERQNRTLARSKTPVNPEKSAQSGSRRWILEKRPS